MPAVTRRIERLELAIRSQPEVSLSLSDAAYILGYERTYCGKIFRSRTGKSFSQWNRDIRIAVAKDMLQGTDLPITAIGAAVGYTDITTFERNFRKSEGLCPSQFRRNTN
ncbi:MAG: AraC family transcriptional regulator [Rubricoccaceae bacterium]|nr:AraC family transcriptional regulator [Rubricoccaceae bacterium]